MSGLSFTARFRKQEFTVQLPMKDPNQQQVASAIAAATGADGETIKLLVPGRKGQMLRLAANALASASEAGKLCLAPLNLCSAFAKW